jgi:predicted PurR-regulated permease PerM
MSGLITLAILAGLVYFLFRWIKRRFKIKTSRNTNIGVIVVFVIVVLMLWGQSIQS